MTSLRAQLHTSLYALHIQNCLFIDLRYLTPQDGVWETLYARCKLSSLLKLSKFFSSNIPILQNNIRSIAIRAVAKANKLDLEEVKIDLPNAPTEYLKLNKLAKLPSFVGSDGYELTESIAIAIYSRSHSHAR